MKKVLSALILTVMLFSTVMFSVSAGNREISVYLDGAEIAFDVKPRIINGRTMVPIRAIFEKLGAVVEWNGNTRTATCTKGDTVVKMTVNSMDMYINNKLTKMDTTPVVIDGRTLAPARYVAEAFGADVQWNPQNSTVVIKTAENKVTLYALDGRTIAVSASEVNSYLNVGWYKTLAETQQTMYAPDGRTITIYKAEVPAYKNVGWYETQAAALAANKTANNSSTSNNPSADGNYYRTPTGKKYHLDPNCGGKNSYKTTNISGLSPCSKCAK